MLPSREFKNPDHALTALQDAAFEAAACDSLLDLEDPWLGTKQSDPIISESLILLVRQALSSEDNILLDLATKVANELGMTTEF